MEQKKEVERRCMKNFNTQVWNDTLARQNWEAIGNIEDVTEMATPFSSKVNSALNVCAPIKKDK